ncbi:MAG: SIMPL domain-containing protein [Candidatus Paceibacterota bacterium]
METNFFGTKGNRTLGALALTMVILALGTYSMSTWKQTEYMYTGPTTISVTGEGEVNALPDIGQFSFAVNASGADAITAKEESGTKINDLIAFLKESGVEEKDIKTDYYNMYPKYKNETKPCPLGSYCPGEQVQDGFEVTQGITVKVRNLDDATKIISGVGDKGATNISGLQFSIDDTSVLQEQARALAIDDAKAKAKVLADKLGVRITKMTGYYEQDGGYPQPYAMGGVMMDRAMSEQAFNGPKLPTGEQMTKSQGYYYLPSRIVTPAGSINQEKPRTGLFFSFEYSVIFLQIAHCV